MTASSWRRSRTTDACVGRTGALAHSCNSWKRSRRNGSGARRRRRASQFSVQQPPSRVGELPLRLAHSMEIATGVATRGTRWRSAARRRLASRVQWRPRRRRNLPGKGRPLKRPGPLRRRRRKRQRPPPRRASSLKRSLSLPGPLARALAKDPGRAAAERAKARERWQEQPHPLHDLRGVEARCGRISPY